VTRKKDLRRGNKKNAYPPVISLRNCVPEGRTRYSRRSSLQAQNGAVAGIGGERKKRAENVEEPGGDGPKEGVRPPVTRIYGKKKKKKKKRKGRGGICVQKRGKDGKTPASKRGVVVPFRRKGRKSAKTGAILF